jgi:hypothetical protein
MPLTRLFKEHPESVGETYMEHMRAALWFSTTMAKAAFCCFVHAFLPFLFIKTGSGAIERLYEAMVVSRDSYTRRKREEAAGAALDSRGSLNH